MFWGPRHCLDGTASGSHVIFGASWQKPQWRARRSLQSYCPYTERVAVSESRMTPVVPYGGVTFGPGRFVSVCCVGGREAGVVLSLSGRSARRAGGAGAAGVNESAWSVHCLRYPAMAAEFGFRWTLPWHGVGKSLQTLALRWQHSRKDKTRLWSEFGPSVSL